VGKFIAFYGRGKVGFAMVCEAFSSLFWEQVDRKRVRQRGNKALEVQRERRENLIKNI